MTQSREQQAHRSRNRLHGAQTFRLPVLALNALSEGDFFGAFALADRWCRVGAPNVTSLLVRAEASNRLGDRDYAFDDIQRALELDPLHRITNLRMLDLGDDRQKLRSARILMNHDRSLTERCLAVFAGAEIKGVGELAVLADRVTGWAVWRADTVPRLAFEGAEAEPLSVILTAEPAHKWSGYFGRAVDFEWPLPEAPFSRVAFFIDDVEICHVAGSLSFGQCDQFRPHRMQGIDDYGHCSSI